MYLHLPLIMIELVLVFGGVLAFCVWQIRSTQRDRRAGAARRAAELVEGINAAEQAQSDRQPKPP